MSAGKAEPFEALCAWRTLEEECAAGDVPHCRAVSAPLVWHPALLERLARLTLNVGPDAPSPVREGHPDLVVAGEVGRAPDVAACRTLIQDLALKPAASVRRLGVVLSADQLLLPAANSLLKLAEEPPSHACLLFLLEGGVILPTLRSRARRGGGRSAPVKRRGMARLGGGGARWGRAGRCGAGVLGDLGPAPRGRPAGCKARPAQDDCGDEEPLRPHALRSFDLSTQGGTSF